jgi:hypothetical protein
LRIQHLLLQRLGLVCRGAVGGHGLLGFQLLEFFVGRFWSRSAARSAKACKAGG